jgi:hypothetical protein
MSSYFLSLSTCLLKGVMGAWKWVCRNRATWFMNYTTDISAAFCKKRATRLLETRLQAPVTPSEKHLESNQKVPGRPGVVGASLEPSGFSPSVSQRCKDTWRKSNCTQGDPGRWSRLGYSWILSWCHEKGVTRIKIWVLKSRPTDITTSSCGLQHNYISWYNSWTNFIQKITAVQW